MTSAKRPCAPRPGICDHCPTGYECGKLSAAMLIIEAEQLALMQGESTNGRLSRLRELLAASGYAYPDGGSGDCQLKGSRWFVREIVAEAVEILSEERGDKRINRVAS